MAGDNDKTGKVGESDTFKMYELEYKIAAERYENIYRAIWQNFSYMAALSAGILTFGSRSLPLSVVVALGSLPLLFWFGATYLPMDHYARSARRSAADIESVLSKHVLNLPKGKADASSPPAAEPARWPTILSLLVSFGLAIFAGLTWGNNRGVGGGLAILAALIAALSMFMFRPPVTAGVVETADLRAMRHFSDFGRDDPRVHWRKTSFGRYFHVNQVVIPCFLALTAMWIATTVIAFERLTRSPGVTPTKLAFQTDTLEMKVTSPQFLLLQDDVRRLRSELQSMHNQLRTQEAFLRSVTSRLLRCSAGTDSAGRPCP